MKIQVVEFCHTNNIPYMEGAVIKYVCRWKDKGGISDLEKAKHYIEMMIEFNNRDSENKDIVEFPSLTCPYCTTKFFKANIDELKDYNSIDDFGACTVCDKNRNQDED